MDALRPTGKWLASAMVIATKGTRDIARKKATSAAALSSSTSLAIAAFGLGKSMVANL
jgi:hypothetical protein